MTVAPSVAPDVHRPNARKAAVSAFLGTALEYYDFFIYGGAAALVFDKVFFPSSSPATATLLSIASLGVAYVSRPLGAVLWGHLGDRLGRRNALLSCLMLMGAATFLVGCLPTYAQLGWLAPVLLVLLRLCQGLSAGGEAPGSSALTIEHAPLAYRGFYGSFTINGIMFGIVLATIVFIPIASLPDEQLYSWGWRVPFWLSVVVAVLAYMLRRTLEETHAFEELKEADATPDLPVLALFRSHWRTVGIVSILGVFPMTTTVVSVYGLARAVDVGFERTTVLWALALGTFVSVFTQPLFALLSDRIGRRPVFIVGALGGGLVAFPFFAALESGSTGSLLFWMTIMLATFYAAASGVYPAFFAEQFPTSVRYSGLAVSVMLGLLVAGFTPAIIQATADGSASVAAWWVLGFQVIAAAAAVLAAETARVPIDLLGVRPRCR